jgi:hypothetical protein
VVAQFDGRRLDREGQILSIYQGRENAKDDGGQGVFHHRYFLVHKQTASEPEALAK